MSAAAKYLGILVDPSGSEFFAAYGPMTKERGKATEFETQAAAANAARYYLGRHGNAFWNSERAYADRAKQKYRGWSYRVDPAQ